MRWGAISHGTYHGGIVSFGFLGQRGQDVFLVGVLPGGKSSECGEGGAVGGAIGGELEELVVAGREFEALQGFLNPEFIAFGHTPV